MQAGSIRSGDTLMHKILVVLPALLAMVAYADDALAQRGRGGGGVHGSSHSAGFGGRGLAPRAFNGHGVGPHSARLHHRPWLRRGGVLVIGAGGYLGASGENCVFEPRYGWNGWATTRDIVPVCY